MATDKVLIVEPSSSGVLLIPAARKLGVDPVVLTYNRGDRIIPHEYLGQAADVLEVDTMDEAAVKSTIGRYMTSSQVLGIVPGFEYHVPISARMSHHFKLKGLDPLTVDDVRLKDRMRARLSACGLNTPASLVVSDRSMLSQVGERVGFPCVLKPVDGSGSLHVKKACNQQELELAYEEACQDELVDMGLRLSPRFIVEAYVSGPEYSVEGYVQAGRIHFLSITEKLLGPEPYFTELGHIVSAKVEPSDRAALYNYTEAVVKALHVNLGPFHCELRLSPSGPILMELAARLPGDNIVELIRESTGVDLAEVMIRSYIGRDSLAEPLGNRRYAGIRFFALEGEGRFSAIEGVPALERLPGFRRFELLAQPNCNVPPPTSSLGRVAKALFTASSYQDLRTSMEQARELIHFS